MASDLDKEKKALVAIRKLRREIEQLKYRQNEPVAIVGLSCRFPQSPDLDAYWRLLDEGKDAVRDVPADRWDIEAYYDPDPDAPGKVYMRQAGYLDGIDEFDAAFFGISPREAEYMDPQQRLLLEQAWSALEQAGIAPASLHGTRSGVYVGVTSSDYGMMIQNADIDPGPYYITGNTLNAAVGRLAYVLRLQGPALAIDTACSSSLVAVHQACASLRNGETDLALAGGVNLLISPMSMIASCRAHMLSPDAHCKTFDSSADGYARGEGCGIVVLKRLSDALRDQDNIQAVIRGSAVNQDGHSSGLTVPNGPAQERVITDALRMAGVSGDEVQYLEAHGTGTPLGDPIELQAASAVLAVRRAGKAPLLVGSVKTNLGHLESAAGMAGLIKVVLSLQHDRIPKQLFFSEPNPHIPWEDLNIQVVAQPEPWPEGQDRRVAGVSAFGVSGTNAHVVLEQAPERSDTDIMSERSHRLLVLSGRTSGALAQIAAGYDSWLEQHDKVRLGDLCYTANTGRNHFGHRAGLVFSSAQQLREQLTALSRGSKAQALLVGDVTTGKRNPKVGFLFTGQGAQYTGMARELYQTEKTFQQYFDRCAAEFSRLCPDALSLAAIVFEEAHQDFLTQTNYIQPALYALQVSLAALWRDWGVVPDALIGHSAGEYAAACTAGVFEVEEGLRLIIERARLMQRLPAGGGMLTVTAPVEVVEAALADDDSACVSAYHGMNTVISGPEDRLSDLMAQFEKQERYCTRLPATNAFHSKLVDPILDDFEAIARGMEYRTPTGKLVSGMTGSVVDCLDAAYWRDQMRKPVRFDSAVRTLFESTGCDVVVEIGPQAELMWLAQMCWRPEHDVFWTSSLEKGKNASEQMLTAAGQLYTKGVRINFAGMEGESLKHRNKIALPTYPFQRQRYWIDLPESAQIVAGPRLKDCLYRSVWEQRDVEPSSAPQDGAGSWLVFCDEGGTGKAVCEVLEARGDRVVQVAANSRESGFEKTLAESIDAAASDGPIQKILYLACLDSTSINSAQDLQRAQEMGVESVLRLTQSLIDRDWKGQLWLATRGVQRVLDSDRVEPAQSTLWGLGKVISMERPRSWGGLVDLPLDAGGASIADLLVSACDCGDFEDLVALREGRRWVTRLLPEEYVKPAQLEVEPEGSYLITGGLGGIGLKIAHRLVQRGARYLVLTSRGEPSQAAETAIRELEEQGCDIKVIQGDVSRESDVLRLFDEMGDLDLPALKGIVHAAGVESVVALEDVTVEELRSVMAAKVFGTWLLNRITLERGIELSFFVCTSSISSVWGSLQQASYAAANAFLTALCEHRLAEGRAATAVCYGPWKEVGMGVSSEDEMEWMRSRGIRAMTPRFCLDGMEAMIKGGVTGITLADINWSTFRDVMEILRPRPLLESLGRDVDEAGPLAMDESGSALAQQLIKASPVDQHQILKRVVREQMSRIMKLPPEDLRDTTGFFELGMDSLMAVEFRNRMEKMLGRRLPATLVMDRPSVNSVTDFVLEEVLEQAPDLEAKDEAKISSVSILRNEPIAVVWPASIGQKRLWFLQQMAPTSPHFNRPVAVRFKKGLRVDLAERVLGELVRRHSALRTTIENSNGELVQVVQQWSMPELRVIDLGKDVNLEDRLKSIQEEEARRPIDIMGGSLIRFTLVNLAASEQVLLMTMHHAISDGLSSNVLLREFLALYEAFDRGEPSPLPQPKAQFVDYAVRESRQLLQCSIDDSVAYWEEALRGIPPLQLPSDRVRPVVQTYVGDSVPVNLSADIQDELRAWSQRARVTPFVTLLAAWSLLLSRYSGQKDFGVGTPVAGRDGPEWSDAIGFFVNMLTLRMQLDQDWTVRELIAHAEAVTKRAYEHQDLPFDWLVKQLNPPRDPGRTPLFQIGLNLQVPTREFQERLDSEGIVVTDLRPMLGASELDLTLDLRETNTGYWGFLEYNPDLFDRWRIEQMGEHFKTLLLAMIRQPDAPISSLPLLGSEERQYLLTEWNHSDRDYPLDQCVHQRIAEQARQCPDEIAVVCGAAHLTYAELNRHANQLAHYLRDRGVGAETLVGLCVDRSIEMIVAILGVLKAGGAYVPLALEFPKHRLELMLEDANVKIIVSQTQLLDRLPEREAEVICLDREADRIANESSHDPEQLAGPDSAVYVIYTSGSTGKPKGVVITHRSLLNLLFSMAEELAFNSQEILLAVTTLSFDMSKPEIFLPLVEGARVVIATREQARDAKLLREYLVDTKATMLQATPATWQMLLKSGWNRSEAVRVLCGGEALGRELAESLLEVTDTLWNLYGPTETTVWSAILQVREVHTPTVPVGHPLANTQLYVLDGGLNPSPVGIPGELFIGGYGLAKGYLNQPELTRERFVPDPFSENSNARLYRTGDLGCRMPDGNIEFLGRLDNQVKIRGFRVEIGDIENALSACEGIRQAAVTTWKGPDGFDMLAGYLVTDSECRPGVDDIKAVLRESLPGYMVPGMLIYLDELPLTPTKKVDRRALPSPDLVREQTREEFIAPRNEQELAVAEIWKEVLKVETIGIRDNFFDLGGHSLMIVEILSKLKQRFETELSVAELFRYETIEALAKYLQQSAGKRKQGEERAELPAYIIAEPEVEEPPQYRAMDGRVYTYRRYCETDRASALAAYAKSFSQSATDVLNAALEWRYLESNSMTGDGSILNVLDCDGDIVGMNGYVSARFKIEDNTIPGYWGSDFHLIPDHRSVSGWAWSEIARRSSGLKLSTPGVVIYPILSGSESVIDIDQYVTLVACLDLGAVLKTRGWPSTFSSICGFLYWPVPAFFDHYIRARAATGIEVTEISQFDERFDRLWQVVSGDYPAIMVRDQAFLSWRFDRCPIRDYTRYAAVRDGEVVGYMVTRVYPEEGTERGLIVDYLVRRDDAAVLSALIQAVVQDFRSNDVVSVKCSLASSQREHIRQFRSHGFLVQRPGAHIVAGRGYDDKALAAIDDWFFTYADGDLDY